MLHFYDRLSINRKIVFVGSCVFLFAAMIIILFAAITTYNTSIEESQKSLDLYAKHEVGEIYAMMHSVVKTAETFSSVVLASEHQMAPRNQLSPAMMQILVDNPDLHGIYVVWERNTIDELESLIYIARDDDWNPQLVQVGEDYINNTLYFNDYYTIPRQTKQPALTDPYIGAETFPPVLMVTVSAPILENGVFKGIVGVDIALDDLNHLIENASIYEGRGRMILISNDGTIVGITGESSMIGKSLEELAPVFGVSADEIVAQFQRQNSALFEIGEYIGATNPVIFGSPDRVWSVVIIIPKSIQSESTYSLVFSLAIVGIIVLICGFFLLSMVANSITRPIKKLTEVAQAVASGDLSKRVNNDGFDEIAEFGRGFDHMTSELQTTLDTIQKEKEKQIAVLDEVNAIARAASEGKLDARGDPSQFSQDNQDVIKSINATLDALSNPLFEAMRMASAFASGNFSARFDQDIEISGDFIPFKDSMDMIGIKTSDALLKIRHGMHEMNDDLYQSVSNVEEIASAVSTLTEGASRVSSLADRNEISLDQALTAMDDLADTVGEVAQRTSSVSELASQSSELAYDGVKSAETAGNGMEEVTRSSAEIAKVISEMSSHMEEIGGIVDVISGIAEQTSLLALNAAIEAARAGDAGLGFAVVADEVKSLAQDSQRSAEHIGSIIGNLQKMSNEMTNGMEKTSNVIQSGSNAVHETVTILNQMAEAIADVNRNMSEVAAASEEQAASVQEITASLSEVRNMVQDTAREATDSAAAAEKINTSLEQLKGASAASGELADMIAGKVNMFKIE